MKILITGAGGFLGRYVTAEAVRRGHSVRAVIRPASKNVPESWLSHPSVEVARGDLRNKKGLAELCSGCDTVIHLAAVKEGDFYEQFGGTVIATENLLDSMKKSEISSIVQVSTFSVYEYMKKRSWSCVNEDSPLAFDTLKRDEYCQTKTVQEQLTLSFAKKNGWRCMVLRPGVIFGRDNLWTARLGFQSSEEKWITIGRFAPLPLTYVENCAAAIILAAEYNGPEQISILNVVDRKTPSQSKYVSFLRKKMLIKPKITRIPFFIMRFIARSAWIFNHLFLQGKGKIPGLFVPERLHGRCKPFRYSNDKIVSVLGWQPNFSWQEGVLRSLSKEDLTSLVKTGAGAGNG